jgi:hypothetical protein
VRCAHSACGSLLAVNILLLTTTRCTEQLLTGWQAKREVKGLQAGAALRPDLQIVSLASMC